MHNQENARQSPDPFPFFLGRGLGMRLGGRGRERKKERGRERKSDVKFFVSSALELQPDHYCGEVLGRQGTMEDSRDMFKLAAQTETRAL